MPANQPYYQERYDTNRMILRSGISVSTTSRRPNQRPSRPKMSSQRSRSRRNIHVPLTPTRSFECGDRYPEFVHPVHTPENNPGYDIPRQSVSSTLVGRPPVPHRTSRSKIHQVRFHSPYVRLHGSCEPVMQLPTVRQPTDSHPNYQLHDIPRQSICSTPIAHRMSRPKIHQVRSHSRRVRVHNSCSNTEPVIQVFTPGQYSDVHLKLDTTHGRKLDDVPRATIRPLAPRKLTDHGRSRLSRPQISARSHSRRHMGIRSSSYRQFDTGDREHKSAAAAHSYNQPTQNADQYDRPEFSAPFGKFIDQSLDALSQRQVATSMLPRPRASYEVDVPLAYSASPVRVHSGGLTEAEQFVHDYRMAASKAQRIQACLDADANQNTEVMVCLPVSSSTISPSSMAKEPPQVDYKVRRGYATTNLPIQRDISQASLASRMTRYSLDREAENDIIDLYAELNADGDQDAARGKVELLRFAGPMITLNDMPNRLQTMLASIDLSQTPQSLQRQVSQACSVRALDLHPDLSRVVHSLRDGTSLDGFVLERVHSYAASSFA